MPRRQRTKKQKAAIFLAHDGECHICGQKIKTGERWELEHIVPYELTCDDSDENLAPAHVSCHKVKTRKDKGMIAKAKRMEANHLGARKPKSPLGKGRFKKKFDGTVVVRETGEPVGQRSQA